MRRRSLSAIRSGPLKHAMRWQPSTRRGGPASKAWTRTLIDKLGRMVVDLQAKPPAP
jgi:hypothetical protein